MDEVILYTVLAVLIVVWFRWRWRKTCVFKELGIPGPKPNFLFGNMLELYSKGPMECEKEWFQKYGKVVGYYYGMTPILLVSEVELLKRIFVKDFHLFCDRPEAVPLRLHGIMDSILPTKEIFDSLLVNLKGQRWKEVRSILTPTFSSSKMKLMTSLMNEAVDVTVSKVGEKACSGETFDIYDIFRRLTLDIICQAAFAVKLNVQHDPHDRFLLSAKIMFRMGYKSKLVFIGMCFPEFSSLITLLNFIKVLVETRGMIPPMKVTWMIGDVIKERRRNPKKPVDLLQMMIDASAIQEDGRLVHFEDQSEKRSGENQSNDLLGEQKKKLQLTDTEIQANALLMFLAGFETTSTVLAYVFYQLVKYPEYQDRIREEIDYLVDKEAGLNYSSVSKLKLLDRFFLETMRIHPPVTKFINRIACVDVNYENLRIKKGIQIQLPIFYIHHSPEFWPDPDVFDPDRFLPENKPANFNTIFVPFGLGPRNCLGIRFAAMEAKLAIAKLLQRFVFVSEAEKPVLELETKVSTTIPKDVFVRAFERK